MAIKEKLPLNFENDTFQKTKSSKRVAKNIDGKLLKILDRFVNIPSVKIEDIIMQAISEAESPLFTSNGTIERNLMEFEAHPPFTNNLLNQSSSRSVVPFWFPNLKLNQKNMDEFMNFLLESSPNIRIRSNRIENGMIKLNLSGEESLIAFENEVRNLAFRLDGSSYQCPLVILPDELAGARCRLSCIVDKNIGRNDFLTSFNSQNNLRSSRWYYNYDEDTYNKKFMIHFSVDPESFHQIMPNNYMLKVCGNNVKIDVEEDPFRIYMSDFSFNTNAN